MNCVIPSCRLNACLAKQGSENISFHRFPRNYLYQPWVDATGRKNWAPLKHHRICSRHFPNDFFVIIGGRRHLLPNAIPTLFLEHTQESDNQRLDSARFIHDDSEEKVVKPSKITEHQRDDGWLVVIGEDRLQPNFSDSSRVSSHGNKIIQTDPISTSPPQQERQHDDANSSDDNQVTSAGNKRNLTNSDVKPPQVLACQDCFHIKRQYQQKLSQQSKEMRTLSKEMDKLKRKLEKAKTDLKMVRTKAKTRLKMISRLRQRYLNLAINTDDSNDSNEMKFEVCLVNETICES